jgi:lipoprotein-anchoring transpeptidase ErfK/SrfK
MRGLAIAAIVIAVAAAAAPLALYSQHAAAPVQPIAHPPHSAIAAKGPPQSSPPLAGRIQISDAQLHEAQAAGLVDQPIKTILDVPERMSYGEFVWNDRGVPAGPVWIRVDLGSQLLSVFRSGHEIGTAVILYGADGLATPTGKFPILAKWKDHKSATYGDAPMPYTLRLTNDGVSIHGSNVRWGFATHGCIGVPKDFAAKLFDVVQRGDEVLIVSGKASVKNA